MPRGISDPRPVKEQPTGGLIFQLAALTLVLSFLGIGFGIKAAEILRANGVGFLFLLTCGVMAFMLLILSLSWRSYGGELLRRYRSRPAPSRDDRGEML